MYFKYERKLVIMNADSENCNLDNTDYKFSDLFDLKEIQKIQDAFSRATGLSTIITEPDGTPITEYSGFSCYCEMIRSTKDGLRNCMYSDSVIGRPQKYGPRLRRCLSSGLLDAGASIMVGDKHVASWLLGQVMDEQSDREELKKYAEKIGIEKEAAEEAINKITCIPKKKFEAISEFLFLNARQLSMLAIKNVMQAQEISKRKAAEASLAKEKEIFEVTIHSIGDAVITTDTEENITNINALAEELIEWKKCEAVGLPLDKVFKIIDEKTHKHYDNPVRAVLKTGNAVIHDKNVVLFSKTGIERIISDSVAPIKDKDGHIYGMVLVFRDVTEEKRQLEKIEYLSYHDKLTDLYNRAYFENKIEELEENKELPVSIIIGDINGLKLTNDIFGHTEGDKLLKTISKILVEECRKDNIVSRWGGNEFAIILSKTTYKQAVNVCNKIRKRCKNQKIFTSEKNCIIEPSIAMGIDTKEDIYRNLSDVVKKAEDRMYRNKLLEIKSNRSGTVTSLKSTLFEKSYETEEHAFRLVELSSRVGNALGLTENDIDELKLFAMLHDIGKVGISDTILNKPEKLSGEEWEQMKKHSEIGFRIAQSSYELSHVAKYILCHHERWDGKGYPQGLKGDSIPLFARIVTITDSYDVMTNARPYKSKMCKEDALKEIKQCAGSQFDPQIAETFIEIMKG